MIVTSCRSFSLLAAALLALLVARPVAAQGLPSTGVGLPGGDQSSVTERYNKARKGSSITEWLDRLNDDDPQIRFDAVKSIGDSGDPKAVQYLLQSVGDHDPRIQAKAVDYLGKIRATDASFFLIQRLFMAGTPTPLRHRILMTLGKIGDQSASRPILEFIARDTPADIRGTGLFAIGEIGDPATRQDVAALLETEQDPRMRRLVQEALLKIDTRQAAPPKNEGPFLSPLEAALLVEKQPDEK